MKTDKNIYFAYRSFWPELETMRKFYETGIKTFCFYAANTHNLLGEPYSKYPPAWVWDDTYVFEPVQRQIEDILGVAPEAELICMVDLNTPFWWVRHKGNNGLVFDSFDNLGKVASCDLWREKTLEYLEAFLTFTEKNYKKHIKAYVLSCGSTCEWIDVSRGEESVFRYNAYTDWQKKNQREVAEDILPRSKREAIEHDYLRDPQKNADALDYWKFCNEQIAETAEFFVKSARKFIKRKEAEIGTFYGYILQLGKDRLISGGHLDYERFYAIPELDFIVSPGIYADRDLGGGGGAMMPLTTLNLNGKRFLHECDQRTHTFNSRLSEHARMDFLHFPDEASTVAGMKREMAFSLINQASMWWFDMWGGYYQGENIYRLLGKMKKIWDQFIYLDMSSVSEVLMIVDPESTYYLNEKSEHIYEFNVFTQKKLNRLGAPYDICSLGDLETLQDIERYKFIIITTPFVTNDKREELLREKLMNNNRTILWYHGPGIVHNGKWNENNVKSISGIQFKAEGLSVRKFDNWKSAYIYDPAELSGADLKQLAQGADVNIYCHEEIPVYCNNRLIAIHCKDDKMLKVNLPRKFDCIKELYTETEFHNTDCFEYRTNGVNTLLFELK